MRICCLHSTNAFSFRARSLANWTIPELAQIDAGEREAIQLAQETQADLLLMDEQRGTRLALGLGVQVVRTIDILVDGASRGLVDIDVALARLQQTNFRSTPRLYEEARRRVRQ
jgi:predicted nucleic acid-binding protein